MLALTRKAGQSIIIGDQIEIAIVEIKGDQVRIGIRAPKEVSIYRKELYLEIQAANQAAVNSVKVSFENMDEILSKAARSVSKENK